MIAVTTLLIQAGKHRQFLDERRTETELNLLFAMSGVQFAYLHDATCKVGSSQPCSCEPTVRFNPKGRP